MEVSSVIKKIRQNSKRIIAYSLIFLILGLAGSLLQPQLYRSRSRLLVSMKGSDYYAIDKGNQYFASLLPKIAGSQKFFDDLFSNNQSTFNLDRSYFGDGYSEEMKNWDKSIDINMDAQGILTVDIYHKNPEQAKQISLALDNYLITKQSYFPEIGDKADIKIIDQPMVSRYPVKPNLVNNAIVSIILGAIIGAAVGLARGEKKKKKIVKAIKEAREESKTQYIPIKDKDFLKDNVIVEVKDGKDDDNDAGFKGNMGNILN